VQAISAISDRSGSLDVFGINPSDNNNVWWERYSGGAWGDWAATQTQNGLVQGLGATTDMFGDADVFGIGPDNQVKQEKFDGTSWGSWSATAGPRSVLAVSAITVSLDYGLPAYEWVFGTSTDVGDVYVETFNGTSWAPWYITQSTNKNWNPISATLLPATANTADLGRERMNVLAVQDLGHFGDGQIYYENSLTGTAGAWSTWAMTTNRTNGFIAVR
jgi:hypothetical protein